MTEELLWKCQNGS